MVTPDKDAAVAPAAPSSTTDPNYWQFDGYNRIINNNIRIFPREPDAEFVVFLLFLLLPFILFRWRVRGSP